MPSQLMLHWLLTLEVREPKGWRGMVPMTSGRFKDRFIAPGMSTYTCHMDTDKGFYDVKFILNVTKFKFSAGYSK